MYTTTDVRKSLGELVETLIRKSTHNRVRDLVVVEDRGMVTIRGNVPSQHTKQLALHGALELLSGEQMSDEITVGAGRTARS